MKRKILLSVLCLMLGSMSTFAECQYLTIEKKSGAKISFLLSDNPVITYDRACLIINGSQSTSYYLSDVKKYYFSEMNLNRVNNEKSEVFCSVSMDENAIRVQNVPVGIKVNLYNTNGVVVATSIVDYEGTASLTLPGQKGVYVLSVENQSFKLIRK